MENLMLVHADLASGIVHNQLLSYIQEAKNAVNPISY